MRLRVLACVLSVLAGTVLWAAPLVVFPLERTAYFIGETVPLGFSGVAADVPLQLDAVNGDGRVALFHGKPGALWLHTDALAPGDYTLELNGTPTGQRFTLTSVLRKSAGSMQDEATPRAAWSSDLTAQTLRDSGLTACVELGASDMGRAGYLDAMARTGALLLVNPDTRPTSFFPVGPNPAERDGMSQRMILTAQANGRYPNFGGFLYGWDTTGHAVGGKRGLLIYWGWGDKTDALRHYIDRDDAGKLAEFTRRTGLPPVTMAEYIAYLVSIGHPEMAPAIDLPTKRWLEEIAKYAKPMPTAERTAFETRLDAWSRYLMGLYGETYATFGANLRAVDPSLRHTASVQIDHAPTLAGQYFPAAYAALDLQYQTTWNDQVGGPDYAYQWLFTSALLEMGRGEKPTWISNAMAPVHGCADVPGKLTRVAAHDLAFGGAGVGFALEGFSNLLGGMNYGQSGWENIKGKIGEADVRAARDFLDRFAALAVNGHGDHGVGILFSRTQLGRQYLAMGFGTPEYQALVALTRLGYTPCFVSEEDLLAGRAASLPALVVIGQTVPPPAPVLAALAAFTRGGGRLLVDGGTTVTLPGAAPLGYTFPTNIPGKPHSWSAPNMVGNDNDAILYARWHPALAAAFSKALGGTGHALLASEQGAATQVSLLQIDGGRDAKYVVAVNDSFQHTQADWVQLSEKLAPPIALCEPKAHTALYDCTDEKALSFNLTYPANPNMPTVDCDLTHSTARVYAVLTRPLAKIDLSAAQTVAPGKPLALRVAFLDAAGQPLAGVIPFHLAVRRPDGALYTELYRATDRTGAFTLALPLPANVPAGTWAVAVRCQLTGEEASLPITVTATKAPAFTEALTDRVVVREPAAIDAVLAKGATVVLPLFDSPRAAELRAVADDLQAALAKRGVTVEIRDKPVVGTYTLAYELTDAQAAENARIDAGGEIGRISRLTVNGNDWYSALSGYRCGKPLLLLELAGLQDARGAAVVTNPLATALGTAGVLWPQASAAYPGAGRAVVQGVPWAFAPRVTAVVVQAMDVDGLRAAIPALTALPADRLTPGIQASRAALWREFHVGGAPEGPRVGKLTAHGLTVNPAAQPFAIAFPTGLPPTPAQVTALPPVVHAATAIPATFKQTQYVLYQRDGDGYIETATVGFLMPDLRFSDAVAVEIDVPTAGITHVVADGQFRYNEHKPMWQAQWEDILNLRDTLIPKERRPLHFDVYLDGKPAGTLTPTATAEKDVQLELRNPSGGAPRTAREEVVLQLAGDVTLPAGRHELRCVPQNVVDGHLDKVTVGK